MGNGGVLQSSFQVLHVPGLLVTPLGAGHMAQPGTDQHQSGVSVREAPHRTGAAADLPVQSLNDIIGSEPACEKPLPLPFFEPGHEKRRLSLESDVLM